MMEDCTVFNSSLYLHAVVADGALDSWDVFVDEINEGACMERVLWVQVVYSMGVL